MTPSDPVDPRADLRWGTIGGLLADVARRFPDGEALVEGDMRLTYAALDAEVTAVARAFLAAGLRRGDRVAIWGPNSARWIIAALAAQRAGGVLVPLNTRFKGDEAAFILAKSGARMLCTVRGFLGNDYPAMLTAAAGDPGGRPDGDPGGGPSGGPGDGPGGDPDGDPSGPGGGLDGGPSGGPGGGRPFAGLPDLGLVVCMEGPAGGEAVGWDGFVAAGRRVAAAEVERRAAEVGPDDLADMLFTSGTTGRPKGAMCTHAQTLRAYGVWGAVVGLRAGDRYLIINPFFHGFGYKAGWLVSLMSRATIIPERTLDVPHVLEMVRREKVTVLPGTPTLYQTMLEHPDFSADGVATLRLAVTGAASIPPTLLYRIREELGFAHIVTGYGLTESCAIVSMCRYDDDLETVATTAGLPLPGLEVIAVDRQDVPVPPGAEGEILVRGYTVMKGYFHEESETAATITPGGWLRTGDIGVIDESGRIRITDRLKDMYIVGGFNAYPAEIERVIEGHPAVAQVAVIGVPDARMGEVGAAFVVPRRGRSIEEGELIAWCRGAMANYKVPRRVHVLDGLPTSAAGKVLKTELRRIAPGDREGPPPPSHDATADRPAPAPPP